MTSYFRAEINGNAQDCAKLINELRDSKWDIYVDGGYLIVSEIEWDRLEQLATTYHCEINSLSQVQQAA